MRKERIITQTEIINILLKPRKDIWTCSNWNKKSTFLHNCSHQMVKNFLILLNHLKYKNKTITVCGDFNINFLINDSTTSEFISLINFYNLINTIESPTSITSLS